MDKAEALWRQYSTNIDLYKHYLKISIEFNVFYYAITGAILSFYLKNADAPMLKWSLVLPLAMSALFAGFFVYGAILMDEIRKEVFNIRDALGFQTAPEVRVLSVLLWIFAALMLIVAIAIVVLLIKN